MKAASFHSPRYLAYCVAHGGLSPEEQRAADMARYVNQWTHGYVFWVRAQMLAWCKPRNKRPLEMTWQDQNDFTEWLLEYFPPPVPKTIQHFAAGASGN